MLKSRCDKDQATSDCNTVDDINPALPLRTLNYGNGTFLIVGPAGFHLSEICAGTTHLIVETQVWTVTRNLTESNGNYSWGV